MGTERNITGNWPNHFYFIPAGSFDSEAPTVDDINEAIKQARHAVSVLKSPSPEYKEHFLGEWASIAKDWEGFAKRDPHQDFRPHKIKLGFDPAERPERTYSAPLNFFNQIKEQDNMVRMSPTPTITIFAGAGKNYLDAAAKNIAEHHSLELPEAVIGETLNGLGNNPWVGHIGNLSISHKTDAARHIELALEHLVAAQTIPALQEAYECSEAKRAERLKAEFMARLHQPNYLDVLSGFNQDLANGAQYGSWREVQRAGVYSDAELEDFIALQRSKQLKARAEAEHRAKVEATYHLKRREELVQEHGSLTAQYRYLSDVAKSLIDSIIHKEIADGACK